METLIHIREKTQFSSSKKRESQALNLRSSVREKVRGREKREKETETEGERKRKRGRETEGERLRGRERERGGKRDFDHQSCHMFFKGGTTFKGFP
jgi:hypothetical protein